jgi:putative pyruvate formate lyase activating enzyme
MRCVFCQNHQLSHENLGEDFTPERLARTFLLLQTEGCHNIELVSPTPHIPAILEALATAVEIGLRIPIAYNSNGYLTYEALDLLDGIVDIYMPDMKFSDDDTASRLASAPRYRGHNRDAAAEMFRQVGSLTLDSDGMAERGTLVRILLLPRGMEGAEETLRFVATSISPDISVSIMGQYAPLHKASEIPGLLDPIPAERAQALASLAGDLGFGDLWVQEEGAEAVFIPDFRQDNPFGEANTAARGIPPRMIC